MHFLQGLAALAALCAVAWALSEDRRRVPWRLAASALALQVALGGLLLGVEPLRRALVGLNVVVEALDAATRAGSTLVFGYLGGGPTPFESGHPGASFVLAFQALPIVMVMSALSALLFHWRILPKIVAAFSRLLERALGIGGAEGLGAAANVFVGMVESPLLIRPYLERMNRSELFSLMTCGMATIAGTVMVLYSTLVGPLVEGALGHILTASILSAPAAILVAKLMVPPQGPPTPGEAAPSDAAGAMDAITRGTLEGLKLWLNIIAMLLVLTALVHLANQLLSLAPLGGEPLTLQRLLGWAMAPLVWLIGVPWSEAAVAGELMGVKTVLNEFLAYLQMAQTPPEALGPRSRAIMVYALCGFANFGSLGIMIGGLTAMAPSRSAEIVGLGLRSIVSGTLATLMTGAVAGMFL